MGFVHLKQEPNGTWRVIVQWAGARRSATAETRMSAMRKGADLIMSVGGDADISDMSVGELVADYLNDLERRASPKYFDEAERAAERIPVPFQNRRAREVTGLHLDALYRQLAVSMASSSVRRIHTVIMAAYGRAVKLGALPVAPKVGKPTETIPDVKPPSHDDAKRVLAACSGLTALALRLSAVTGCRRGEVVAIQWQDLDLERSRLHVRRSLIIAKRVVHERPTKTGRKGQRIIVLDLPTMTLLRKHRTQMAETCMAAGLPAPVWVISDDGHTPWRPDRLSAEFASARTASGVPGFRLHDLRHYVATTMLTDGVPLAKVAQRLGHASQATTAEVYSHWIDDEDGEASERLASRLG
jgi:integrase